MNSLGTGEMVIINDECPHYVMDIGYFFSLKDRLQILYPLQFTKVIYNMYILN